ncbi:MAG: hypothetical protein IK084_03040 [Bacteroidaceae bacterium]|nr:hypothetical protein [Bacteroidaceae bacterium]
MARIENERAEKARQYIYSGKAFKESALPVEDIDASKVKDESGKGEKKPVEIERLSDARDALFSGKLFKRGEDGE